MSKTLRLFEQSNLAATAIKLGGAKADAAALLRGLDGGDGGDGDDGDGDGGGGGGGGQVKVQHVVSASKLEWGGGGPSDAADAVLIGGTNLTLTLTLALTLILILT